MKQLLNNLLLTSLFVVCLILIPTNIAKAELFWFNDSWISLSINNVDSNNVTVDRTIDTSYDYTCNPYAAGFGTGEACYNFVLLGRVEPGTTGDLTIVNANWVSSGDGLPPTYSGSFQFAGYNEGYSIVTFHAYTTAGDSIFNLPFAYEPPAPDACTNGATNPPTCTKSCPDGSTTTTNGECPVAPPITPLSVTVWANGILNNISIPYNGTVDVTWESYGATSCVCTYENGDCTPLGTTAGPNIKAKNNPYTLAQSKTFTVVCNDDPIDGGGGGGGGGGVCPSYYPTCFIADTLVTMADGSKKDIQDVKIGDVLKGEKSNNRVLGLHQPKLNEKKLYSFNGGRYFVTAEHPFRTTKGWKSIDPKLTASENIGITVTELKVGDTLITDDGNILLKTINSKNEKENTDLYNFVLGGDHTYYADGYLVHNKLACVDGQIPNQITGGCEPPCSFNCPYGYTKTCETGATLCTETSCSLSL